MKKNDEKEIKYLNVCMDKALHEEFEQFCKDMGMSKTGACENAIRLKMLYGSIWIRCVRQSRPSNKILVK